MDQIGSSGMDLRTWDYFDFPSLEMTLPYRPNPAPSNISSSVTVTKVTNKSIKRAIKRGPSKAPNKATVSPELLRIQPYLKFPGFDLPKVIITDRTKGFVDILGADQDLPDPESADLPIKADEMPYHVCFKIEQMFAAVIGVLYANKGEGLSHDQFWLKVQRVLTKRDPAWKHKVAEWKICELVDLYAIARKH
ncbi:hypothetical protein CORC01_08367 [Colletotrichum orchidophilum]|uniref:Uncharacterized protein n=1 Tax=Colletotrichum orchidophilum TaxID=1209926 RepID=A0A1G4B4R6_9PEZI|nr:uncharacterized protein CORC01_08367 [Colletotrichum orchidophilum]OHE96295.1 hypothetical protein CORC01_08367 [Colletotrichum orchidophilum]